MKLVPNKYLRRNIIDLKEKIPSEFGRFIVALRNLELSEDWSDRRDFFIYRSSSIIHYIFKYIIILSNLI